MNPEGRPISPSGNYLSEGKAGPFRTSSTGLPTDSPLQQEQFSASLQLPHKGQIDSPALALAQRGDNILCSGDGETSADVAPNSRFCRIRNSSGLSQHVATPSLFYLLSPLLFLYFCHCHLPTVQLLREPKHYP